MKLKNAIKYLELSLRMALIFIINGVLYFTNLSLVLGNGYIILATFITSILEIAIFHGFIKRSLGWRIFQAILYLILTLFKFSAMIYFQQYGTYHMFERMDQASYIPGMAGYIINVITVPMIVFMVLSILFSIFLLWDSKNLLKLNSKQKKIEWLIRVGLIIVFLSSTFYNPSIWNLDVYHALSRSFYQKVLVKEEKNNLTEVTNHSEKMNEKQEKELLQDIFKNYGHQNEYTGIAKDKNILIIQVESLQDNFIGKEYNGKEITPNLNRLIEKSFYFTDYYELLGFGNSSDAEYVSLHSTFSNTKKGAYEEYANSQVYGLPRIANDKGYQTFSAHGNTGEYYNRSQRHKGIGFEHVYMGEQFEQDEIIGLGLSDRSMFRQTVRRMEELNQKGKFMGFMITLTCHGPFEMPVEYMVFDVRDDLKNTTFGRYLNAVHYSDTVIGELLEELDKKGILQDTVVAIYGDHHAFANVNVEDNKHLTEFIGKPYDFDEMMRIPLIIYVPGYEKAIVRDNIGSQLDFMPTLCNLMGWNEVVTPMFGVDLLDDQLSQNNIVFPQTYMLEGSFITDQQLFEKSRIIDGMAGRLINRSSRQRLPEKEAEQHYQQAFYRISKAQDMYYHNQIQEYIKKFEETLK